MTKAWYALGAVVGVVLCSINKGRVDAIGQPRTLNDISAVAYYLTMVGLTLYCIVMLF